MKNIFINNINIMDQVSGFDHENTGQYSSFHSSGDRSLDRSSGWMDNLRSDTRREWQDAKQFVKGAFSEVKDTVLSVDRNDFYASSPQDKLMRRMMEGSFTGHIPEYVRFEGVHSQREAKTWHIVLYVFVLVLIVYGIWTLCKKH